MNGHHGGGVTPLPAERVWARLRSAAAPGRAESTANAEAIARDKAHDEDSYPDVYAIDITDRSPPCREVLESLIRHEGNEYVTVEEAIKRAKGDGT